ncbi:MAG: cellulase family glycosylhydrolase [Bacteroidota bacterium]
MKNIQLFSLALGMILLIASCTQNNQNKSIDEENVFAKAVSIDGTKFIDGFGRQILFNGVNLVNKNPDVNYIGKEGLETFENFKKWGFNVIRLGIIWDGLEPEPGVYNETYLKEIDKQIKMAEENGLFVFLDMHQDLFSVKYSDGAPEWATLDEGKPHVTGSVWSDAYLISPAVQTAWDNFWNNKPVSDSIGVQDHYANAWKHVAKRYVGNNTVIGFDIMNEPITGSEAQMYMPVLFTAYAELISEGSDKKYTAQDVAMMWEENRFEALKKIATKEKFSKVIDAVYEMNSSFERGPLQSFYQKIANAIREVDDKKILFFNHSYFCNSGVRTALEPVKTSSGQVDPLVAYAAHGYDLLVDTDELSNSSTDRLEFIFERINESGKRMNVPVLIGEWGALGGESPGLTELAQTNLRIFEKYLFSNTYWAYYLGSEKYSYFKKAVIRPYPAFISGELISYNYDIESGIFTCKWNEKSNIKAPTKIYIPNLNAVSQKNITMKPDGDGSIIEPLKKSDGGYLIISPLGKDQQREVSFLIEKEGVIDIALSAKE